MASTRRILITGGGGFVGQWSCRAALERGWSVYAGTHRGAPVSGVLTDVERSAICWSAVDVTSDEQIVRALDASAPDFVIHLAGMAYAPEANQSPVRAFDVNALGALRLLAALRATPATRLLVVGSAYQYGRQDPSAHPLREDTPQRPRTPYGAAKAAQELLALQAHRGDGANVVCTRSFNHTGVGHDAAKYLIPGLVRAALGTGAIEIGDGSATRDFLHVADAVEAYLCLLERATPGEAYNVCSGRGITIREVASRVLSRAGVDTEITENPARVRSFDDPVLVGDNTKLRAATGWEPTRSLDDIIDDLIHAAKS